MMRIEVYQDPSGRAAARRHWTVYPSLDDMKDLWYFVIHRENEGPIYSNGGYFTERFARRAAEKLRDDVSRGFWTKNELEKSVKEGSSDVWADFLGSVVEDS